MKGLTASGRRAVQWLRHTPPVNKLRYHLYKAILSVPRRHECNLCGWRGRRFLSYYHRHVLCPRCGSQVRHRLIGAALVHAPARTNGLTIDGATVLHLAPEYCLVSCLAPRARRYVTADLDCASLRLDATRMPFAAGVFDAVIACDVLEHIPDERAALAEVRRVLRPGGVAILTAPTADAETTFEDPAIASPQERERLYGQSDHVRLYGRDIATGVESAGFVVSVVTSAAFAPALVERHVLHPPAPRPGPFGFNDRRVLFARRT